MGDKCTDPESALHEPADFQARVRTVMAKALVSDKEAREMLRLCDSDITKAIRLLEAEKKTDMPAEGGRIRRSSMDLRPRFSKNRTAPVRIDLSKGRTFGDPDLSGKILIGTTVVLLLCAIPVAFGRNPFWVLLFSAGSGLLFALSETDTRLGKAVRWVIEDSPFPVRSGLSPFWSGILATVLTGILGLVFLFTVT